MTEDYCGQCGRDKSFAHSTALSFKGDDELRATWLCSHYCFNKYVNNYNYKTTLNEWCELYDKRLKMKEEIENPDEIEELRKEVTRWKANATRYKNDLETYKRRELRSERIDAAKKAVLEHKARMYDEIMDKTFSRKEA